jgi:uncharacterized membrane protein YvbJ
MTICPMCGNFTDNKNCEVCGIKLNDDNDKDQKDFDSAKIYPSESHIFHIRSNQDYSADQPPEQYR